MRTCETIIDSFTQRIGNREAIAPEEWMQAALFMNVLQLDEKAKLFELEQTYTSKIIERTAVGDSHALAEKLAKTSEEWLRFKKQEAFCKQIEEFIRLAKKHATINHEQGA